MDSTLVRGGADSLDVGHTNLPLATVPVLARDPPDSVMIHIVTAADVRGTKVWLPLAGASKGLVPRQAQGLGLQPSL